MARRVLPRNASDLDPCAPYDVRPEDLRGLPFGMSVRISDEKQEANGSRDLQARRIRSFAREHGLVDSSLIWERTESGKRMAFADETRQQIDAARSGAIRVLVFYDSSRYARSLIGALQVEEELHRLGCFIVYLGGDHPIIASNASTRAAKNREHVDNQEYIDRLARRVGDGIEGLVLRGEDDDLSLVSQAGVAPFGWYRPNKYKAPLAHWPPEKKLILAIIGQFLRPSETCGTVAAWANTAGYTTRRDNPWTKQAIYDLLTLALHRGKLGFHLSRKATGKGYLDGVTGSIDPIIEPDLATRIDAKLAEGLRGRSNAVAASHNRRFTYVLGGLAHWSCGMKATQQYGGSTPHPRYHHPGQHAYCTPERQSYAQTDYMGHLADFWSSFRLADDVCDQVLARLAADQAAGYDEDRRHLEITRLEAHLRAKAVEFAVSGTGTALDLDRLRRETADRIAELREAPKPAANHVNLLAAANLLRTMGALWGDAADDSPELQAARRDLMVAVFDEVVLWGPHIVSLRPRAVYGALVEAGAYQVATRAMPKIEIAARGGD